jgi:adenylate kinase
MLIAITGTPGVGKSTVAKILAEKLGYEYIDLKEFALEHNIGEEKEGELELDVDELSYWVEKELKNKNAVIDGH